MKSFLKHTFATAALILTDLSVFAQTATPVATSSAPAATTATAPVQVAGSATPQAGAPAWTNFLFIGGIILFMWLFVFRPQSKRAKEQREFLAALQPGVEVITAGGVIGTVSEVKDNIVVLNLGAGNSVKVLKSSISGKLETSAAMAKK